MSHTTHEIDFDPSTPQIDRVAHFHHIIEQWECHDEQGHEVSMEGAETEVWIRRVSLAGEDNREYELAAVAVFPQTDVKIDVVVDGNLEVKQRQRVKNGEWAEWTNPYGVKIDLQPPTKPRAPDIKVLGSDGQSATVEVMVVYPDRDLQGNSIEPAQIYVDVLAPCANSQTEWERVLVLDYPVETARFRLPVGEGNRTYQARVTATNMCEIESEPSDISVFTVQNTRLKSSGAAGVKKGCL